MKNVHESHATMVRGLFKDGQEIADAMTGNEAYVLHAAVGISGESGELLDAIKKHVMYKKPLDRVNVVEELGDLEFYMEALRQGLGIDRSDTLHANIKKLGVRYPKGSYSNTDAVERKDKIEKESDPLSR